MEDDDEFGDIYTDVLRPFTASFDARDSENDAPVAASSNAASSLNHTRQIDLNINSDDEEILYGAPDLKNSKPGFNLNNPAQENPSPEPMKFDLNLDLSPEDSKVKGLSGNEGFDLELETRVLEKDAKLAQKINFGDDDEDINIVVEEINQEDELVEKDDCFITMNEENTYNYAAKNENTFEFGNESQMGTEQMIPGLSGGFENRGDLNMEDEWESDESDDDLQIVLNDDNHGLMGIERMPGADIEENDEGDQLVIDMDNGDMGHLHHQQQMMMDEREWEEGGHGADGDRKELGDAAKTSGAASVAQATIQPKIGYGGLAFRPPFHSQFKYVRPGAAPIPGAAPVTSGGIPGQVRPPVTMAPVAGRGRGDWRPAGIRGTAPMQNGFQPGYGLPAWGSNSAGRGYGSGLDFFLPSHKTIFEVDIDTFEEKPWKLPGMDISDFFNFGLNEDSWKDYSKHLEQLRLETTMQSKIRVYESGRAEQDYDPDLPPELAAAVGMQEVPSESANPGKADAGQTESARASEHERQSLPMGRPIPVETSFSERLPSADTRRPRMHDVDAIIEVFCHGSTDDDNTAEQQDDNSAGKDLEGSDAIDDLQKDDSVQANRISHAYDGRKRELNTRRKKIKDSVGDDGIVGEQHQPDGTIGVPEDAGDHRSTKGKEHAKSPKMTIRGNKKDEETMDDPNEESFNSGHSKQSSLLSSHAIGSDGDQIAAIRGEANDESLMDDDISFDLEREEINVDETTVDTRGDGNSTKKPKISSHGEQLSEETDEGDDSKFARSRENSKARSGNGKDHQKFRDSVEDGPIQDRRPPRAGNIKRSVGGEEISRRKGRNERDEAGRNHMSVKGREDSYSHRAVDTNPSFRHPFKGDSADWRKENDMSEGSWHWRDDNHHIRRTRVQDTRKADFGGEIGSRNRGKVRENEIRENDNLQSRNQLDNGSWRLANHDHDMGSRQRDKDNRKNRNAKIDNVQSLKKKEESHKSQEHASKEDISDIKKESSSRRKREGDDGSDHRKRDDQARLKGEDVHFIRQKEDGPFQRERIDGRRERDEWNRFNQTHEETLSRREGQETRPVMRTGRATEEKAWISQSRGKDNYRGSSREYHPKDVGRPGDQQKRRDRVEGEIFLQHKGQEDVYASGNQISHDEKRARYEMPGTRNERVPRTSETSRVREHKQRENSRKGKDPESGAHSSIVPSKRNRDEYGGLISEKVKSRGKTERESGENEIQANHKSAKKHKEDASSDDESMKGGRSKLERWTSHKERDFTIASMSSSSLKIKDLETNPIEGPSLVTKHPEEPSKKVDDIPKPSLDDKDKETGSATNTANEKVATEDKHLDTVAKLKKRSERFKLPMPSEKEVVMTIKKMESEPLPSSRTETIPDLDIKPERPARKRRWTGN